MLKTFQRLGYPVFVSKVPAAIIQHVVGCCQLSLSSTDLENYDTSRIRRKHITLVRDYLGLKAWGPAAKQAMTEALETAAISKHDLADIINVAIEELIRQRFELPGFSSLVKAARSARHTITESYYQIVLQVLGTQERIQLDRMFMRQSDSDKSQWNDLKQEPGQPMLTHLKEGVIEA